MVEIVKATSVEDIQAVRQLLEEYGELRQHDAALGDYFKELKELPGYYAPPEGSMRVAYVDGKPAGCLAIRKIGEGICEMKRFYVSPNYRGLKIGRKLSEAITEDAEAIGYCIIRLDTHPWMHAAQHIYLSMGFKEIDAYNDNPTPGIRFFEKKLS